MTPPAGARGLDVKRRRMVELNFLDLTPEREEESLDGGTVGDSIASRGDGLVELLTRRRRPARAA